jgi:hypothetical protein
MSGGFCCFVFGVWLSTICTYFDSGGRSTACTLFQSFFAFIYIYTSLLPFKKKIVKKLLQYIVINKHVFKFVNGNSS